MATTRFNHMELTFAPRTAPAQASQTLKLGPDFSDDFVQGADDNGGARGGMG